MNPHASLIRAMRRRAETVKTDDVGSSRLLFEGAAALEGPVRPKPVPLWAKIVGSLFVGAVAALILGALLWAAKMAWIGVIG